MEGSSGAAGRVEPERSVVVYDPRTGEIILVHHFAAMSGAELPPRGELHATALRHAARRHGRDANEMAAIDVDPGDLRSATAYGVSVADRTLEEVPKGRRAAPSSP